MSEYITMRIIAINKLGRFESDWVKATQEEYKIFYNLVYGKDDLETTKMHLPIDGIIFNFPKKLLEETILAIEIEQEGK